MEEQDRPSLNADVNLFKLIHAHLKGYEILPLPPQGIPCGDGEELGGSAYRPNPHLSKEATLKNLLRDATDFGLKNLAAKIEQEMANQAKASSPTNSQKIDHAHEATKEDPDWAAWRSGLSGLR
jgi:hypothetical protein